jgi:hypothetical protein
LEGKLKNILAASAGLIVLAVFDYAESTVTFMDRASLALRYILSVFRIPQATLCF